jgi:hypothetical protein
MKDPKDFPKPFDEWVEEEVTIRKLVPTEIDETTGKFKLEYKDLKTTQKTMYVNPAQRKVMCSQGTHEFFCIDNHKYLFACRKCDFRKQAFPVTYDLIDSSLVHKISGIKV